VIATEKHSAAIKSSDEALAQFHRAVKGGPQAYTKEELAIKKFYWEKENAEQKVCFQAIKSAKHELEKAEIVHAQHRILAPAGGKIIKIHNDLGEAVKYLGTIIEIAVDGK
jgi:hypothetical protein